MTGRTRSAGLEAVAVIAASLAAGAAWAWFAGEDANWDWQNYHEYNAWALLTGRYGYDVVPAGLQTYFNPIVYLPVYLLRHAVAAPYGGVIMGAVHGLNLALVYALTRTLLGRAANAATLAASVLIAATGAMTVSEVGTSLADVLTALPVVAGIIVLLRGEQARAGQVIVAGLLIGMAVGFKLTNVVFAVGAAAAMLMSARPAVSLCCLAVGGAVGAALSGGAWSLMLWRDLGNPVFPLFNAVFHSPELADTNIMDLTFVPQSFWDGVAYPLYWLTGDSRTAEVSMRDARFAALVLLVPICVAARIKRWAAAFQRMDLQLFVFFAISYVTWLIVFSIQRYIVVLELLCGPVIVLALSRLLPDRSDAPAAGCVSEAAGIKPAGIAAVCAALAIALWGQPADWWRRPWSHPYRPALLAAALQQPATYFLLEKPLAYVAPRFPSRSRFYQLADIGLPIVPNGVFDRRIRAALADPLPGGAWALHVKGHPMRDNLLDRYGLTLDPSRSCLEIDSVIKEALEACPLAVAAVTRRQP
jgi:hypothetical protein